MRFEIVTTMSVISKSAPRPVDTKAIKPDVSFYLAGGMNSYNS